MRFSADESRALEVMGLGSDTDRTRLRRRYSELVRRYHPDRNGGDRRHEAQLVHQLARVGNVGNSIKGFGDIGK